MLDVSTNKFSRRSRDNLRGVHADLIIVVTTALMTSPLDFVVTEGLRNRARQQQLVDSGASKTMNSRHLTGHAVDLAVWLDGGIRWDWGLYDRLAVHVKDAAALHGIPIIAGADWASFRDGPHFQLPWSEYPA